MLQKPVIFQITFFTSDCDLISSYDKANISFTFLQSLNLIYKYYEQIDSMDYARVDGVELFLKPKTPKSKGCISIPEFLYDEIQEYTGSLYECAPDDRIFYFTKSALEKEIKRKAAEAELPLIRVHNIRHPYFKLTTKIFLIIKPAFITQRQTLLQKLFSFNYQKN